ncbi:hypothetical protein ACJX0J_018589 [Zea mays]
MACSFPLIIIVKQAHIIIFQVLTSLPSQILVGMNNTIHYYGHVVEQSIEKLLCLRIYSFVMIRYSFQPLRTRVLTIKREMRVFLFNTRHLVLRERFFLHIYKHINNLGVPDFSIDFANIGLSGFKPWHMVSVLVVLNGLCFAVNSKSAMHRKP